jgi:hypothetical protein
MTDPADPVDPGDPADPADPAGEARRRESAQKIQDQLDEALADSFPASDPVSIVTSHQEEDWGDAAPPPAPQRSSAEPKER